MERYQHSGRITLAGIVQGIALGGLVAFLLSIPYAYITVYVPIIYVNFIATGAIGAVVGLAAARGARSGRLQSPGMYVVVGGAAGILAVYFCWAFWIFALSQQAILTFDPVAIYHVAAAILPHGTWGLKGGENVAGSFLAIIWLIEAGVIILVAAALALDGLKKHICCPQCQKWFKSPTQSFSFAIPEDLEPIVERLNKLDLSALAELAEVDTGETNRFLTLDLYRCPSCSAFSFFSFDAVEVWEEKGEVKSRRVTLIDKRILPNETDLASLLAQKPSGA